MLSVKGQIISIAKQMHLLVQEISTEKTQNLIEKISQKYISNKKYLFMWEGFAEKTSVRNSRAWSWIGDFVGNSEAIIFFNPNDETCSFFVQCGQDLVTILGEMYNCEFYVTNNSLSYLLCFNHHDVLIACGQAMEWLRKYENID